jgi:hypothetical protein
LAAAEVFDGGDGSDFDAVLASTDGPAAAAPAEDPPEGGGAAAVKEEEEEAGIEEEGSDLIGGGDLLSAALADGAEEALLVPSLVFVESVGLAAAAISLTMALVSTLGLERSGELDAEVPLWEGASLEGAARDDEEGGKPETGTTDGLLASGRVAATSGGDTFERIDELIGGVGAPLEAAGPG